MIGLQEMLLQTDDKKLYLFPAWPKDWDVHFKLHAPYQTTVEGILRNGKVETLKGYNPHDEITPSLALSGIGDAYMEQNNTEEAISYYENTLLKKWS